MSEPSKPQSPEDFDSRLARARDRERAPEERSAKASPQGGLALASRIGTELVVALVVGVLIGLGIDRWLDTQPWFLIGLTLLGGAAGILNVFRLSTGQGYAVGYRREDGNGLKDGSAKSNEHKG